MMAPGRAKIGPTSPKMAQDSPKMAPRCAQVALRCPSCPEDGAKKPFLEDVSSENAISEALEALKITKTRIFRHFCVQETTFRGRLERKRHSEAQISFEDKLVLALEREAHLGLRASKHEAIPPRWPNVSQDGPTYGQDVRKTPQDWPR